MVVNRPAIAISSISRFERVHTMMNSNNNLRYRHFGRGFSLIEMMIAILIGIILSIGLVQVMVAGKTAAQATQGANFMQENARYAMVQLNRSIQMAGHLGSSKPTAAAHSVAAGGVIGTPGGQLLTDLGACAGLLTNTYNGTDNKDPEAFWTLGVVGIDNSVPPTTTLSNACIPDYVANTDVIVLRYADSDFLPCTGACTAAPVPPATDIGTTYQGLFVRVAVGGNAILMTATEVGTPGSNPLYTAQYSQSPTGNQDGLYTYPYRLEIYYVRSCSNPNTAATCGATADNGNPIPSLWRRRLSNDGTLVLEPVVEGIEMLHLEYGMAANYASGSGIPAIFAGVQTYESAAQVTAGSPDDWVGIVGVRVGIMAQGDSFNSSGTRGNVAQQSLQGTWTLGSNPTTKYAPQYPSAAAAALLQHTVYTTLGNLRNQNRG